MGVETLSCGRAKFKYPRPSSVKEHEKNLVDKLNQVQMGPDASPR